MTLLSLKMAAAITTTIICSLARNVIIGLFLQDPEALAMGEQNSMAAAGHLLPGQQLFAGVRQRRGGDCGFSSPAGYHFDPRAVAESRKNVGICVC